ncbi:Amidase [Pleurostoma richardsiae]|uniref:Amidase n=1 Tax=Pleurostoma richardsiae TaxID=41990 RepID=A0AA38RIM0_9PEZI|nr:Amidase [Pleurostoma richardsiae]
MSRNIRIKFPSTPVKASKRRGSDSSSLNLSSDDGYSALDEISDSEDDDEDVYAAEEEHIIKNTLRRKPAVAASSPRPVPTDDDDDDADEEDEDEDDEDDDEDEGGVEAEDAAEEDDDENDTDHTASWDGILSDVNEHPDSQTPAADSVFDQDMPAERHVRFLGVPDSDSDSTDSDTTNDIEDFFPDIFVSQDALDSKFRREIEQDPDDSSNSGSFWDYSNAYGFPGESDLDDAFAPTSQDATPIATPMPSLPPTEVSTPVPSPSPTVQELDGYETDGDTTEEDVPEPPVRRKQVRRGQAPDDSGSETDKPIKFRRGQPRIGRFNLDSSEKKPICVVNPISRKMMIFTPQKLRRLDLAPESFNFDFFTNPGMTQSSPILSNSASLMMGAMFSSNTFGDFMNTQAIGPAEAFFSIPSDAMTADNSDDSEADDDEDEEERNLKLEDFITFEDHSSGEEDQDKDEASNWIDDANGSVTSTPRRPSTAASTRSDVGMGLHPLLNHFGNNSNAVGAFRRNQLNQQLIFSDKATQESLAFSSPYYHGTLKGIKSGSLETVTAPITPVRRRKRSNVGVFSAANDLTRSPLESMSQKRKASAGIGESHHKRHRSISDVKALHL